MIAPPTKTTGRSVESKRMSVPASAMMPLIATSRLRPKRSASQPLGRAASKMQAPTISMKSAVGPTAFSRSSPSRPWVK